MSTDADAKVKVVVDADTRSTSWTSRNATMKTYQQACQRVLQGEEPSILSRVTRHLLSPVIALAVAFYVLFRRLPRPLQCPCKSLAK